MVTADGAFEIHWDTELERLKRAAAVAYRKEAFPSNPLNQRPPDIEDIIGQFDWIPGMFDTLREIPSPRHAMALAAPITKVTGSNDMDYLEPATKGADVKVGSGLAANDDLYRDVASSVDGWQGLGADSFRTYFDRVPDVIANQVIAAQFLSSTAKANAVLLRCARQDAEKIPKLAIEALEALDDGVSFKTVLSVFIAVGTIAAGIATIEAGGAALMATGFTILGGLSDGVQAIADEAATNKTAERELGGDTVEEVLNKMTAMIGEVTTSLVDGESKLEALLTSNSVFLSDPESRMSFVVGPPKTFLKGHDFQPPAS